MDFLALIAFSLWLFWHGYIHGMGLYRAKLKGRLVGGPLLLSLPMVGVFFLCDFLMQFTVASVVFWKLPEGVGLEKRKVTKWGLSLTVYWPVGDWLVTKRLRRYIAAGPQLGLRYRMAEVLCRRYLDPFDPTGAHCDSEEPRLAEAGK